MVSDDGINWKIVDEILQSDTKGHMTFPHVVSFKDEGDVYALYVHEDFMTQHNRLVRYTIDKEDRAFEFMLNAARLYRPIAFALFENRTAIAITDIMPLLKQAEQKQLITLYEDSFALTEHGQLFYNDFVAMFL